MAPFVSEGGFVAQSRMSSMGVVPSFDESEDCHSSFYLVTETTAVEEFAFEGGKEAFAQGVVKAVSDRSGRRAYAGLFAAISEGDRSILRSVVRVMDDSLGATLP